MFTLSSHTTTSARSAEDIRPLHEIFPSASQEGSSQPPFQTCGHDTSTNHEVEPGVHKKESDYRLQDVASKVQRRISGDSSMSKLSSKRRLRSSLSEEDIERRREPRRALRRTLQDDLLDDRATSHDGYDEDAVPIKTPEPTIGRLEGSMQINPKGLSIALRRSESPSRSSHTELNQRDFPQTYAPRSTAVALSRMLTQRGGRSTDEPQIPLVVAAAEAPREVKAVQNYIFDELDTPERILYSRSPSPLGRSNTVVHAPSSTKPLETELINHQFLDVSRPLPPPEMSAIHLASADISAAERNTHLSFSEGQKTSLANVPRRTALTAMKLPAVYDTKIRPASEQWLRGASGLLNSTIHQKHLRQDHGANGSAKVRHRHRCDPGSEETEFGSIDGKDESPSSSRHQTISVAKTRSHSEGSDTAPSDDLYNMHIPQRLASKPLLPSVSLPHLQRLPRRERSYISGGSSYLFSVKQQRQASKSELNSEDILIPWGNPAAYATSSMNTSAPESFASSPIRRISSLSDRLCQFKASEPNDAIISVPASKLKSVDLDQLERQTADINFHLSNESLTKRELTAVETHILVRPRAKTLPKNSRIREDFEQISAEIARTNSLQRRVASLDGSGDSHPFGKQRRDGDTTSIWEKALREHAEEDAAILKTRPGSDALGIIGTSGHDLQRNASIGRCSLAHQPQHQARDPSSVRSWEGTQLQARLEAYTLPTRVESSSKKPIDEITKNSSSSYSTGSWARFPSHSRPERSTSPAGESDHVYTRDFAISVPGNDLPPKSGLSSIQKGSGSSKQRKSRSMNFGKEILSSLSRLYKSESQDIRIRFANEARGHRSSISEGGVLEYPELEMLGIVSPPLLSPPQSPALASDMERDPLSIGRRRRHQHGDITMSDVLPVKDAGQGAGVWSKLYEDCVVIPKDLDEALISARSKKASINGVEEDEEEGEKKDQHAYGSRSSELRASTLDFKKNLEKDESRERVKALGLAVGTGTQGAGG